MTQATERPAEETALLNALALAQREAREAQRESAATARAIRTERMFARQAGQELAEWHERAAAALTDAAAGRYAEAIRRESAALADLSRYVDRQLAAASAPAPAAPAAAAETAQ